MNGILVRWFRTYFSDPEGATLAVILTVGFGIVIFLGHILAPLLVSIVSAYLLEGIVGIFERRGVPRMVVVVSVFLAFILVLLLLFFGLVPRLIAQVSQLTTGLPTMISKIEDLLNRLPALYPQFISSDGIKGGIEAFESSFGSLGRNALSFSLTTIMGLFTFVINLVIVPFLVFFFLKDKRRILDWFAARLPSQRTLATRVWVETDRQIGNYVRGKFVEIIVVGSATFLVFFIMNMKYAALLAVLVGLSVLIPYIGAMAVTVPVLLIAYIEWGLGPTFAYLMLAYALIHALDTFLLVPLLFSEAVSLHPVVIVGAILLFGGIWGFWGLFFAIPLAAFVKVLMTVWPRGQISQN